MQVPNFVAKRWRADCQKAAKSLSDTPIELGMVRIARNATEVRQLHLLLLNCLDLIYALHAAKE